MIAGNFSLFLLFRQCFQFLKGKLLVFARKLCVDLLELLKIAETTAIVQKKITKNEG